MNQALVKDHKESPHISVAPMMDWTDRHCRHFHRVIAPDVRLYTEMVTCGAIIHGDRDRFLRFNESEHPVALQLGGSEAADLAKAVRLTEPYGYDEINLNCGCPSERVQSGAFGACLMREPGLVADCVHAMQEQTDKPVTIKCRIGIDEQTDFDFLDAFIKPIKATGCRTFILHARSAWLKGLSPKENREIPPLDYNRVIEIKEKHPELEIILNGGIRDIETVSFALEKLDGAMIGREAYQNPWFLRELQLKFLQQKDHLPDEFEVVRAMIPYAREQKERYGTPLKSITRHMTGLFSGKPGARRYRQILSTKPHSIENIDPEELIEEALSCLTPEN